MTEQPQNGENPEIKWNNRRRLAWISFTLLTLVGISILIFALTGDPAAARVDKISFFIGTLFGLWGGIIASYIGASAWVNVKTGK